VLKRRVKGGIVLKHALLVLSVVLSVILAVSSTAHEADYVHEEAATNASLLTTKLVRNATFYNDSSATAVNKSWTIIELAMESDACAKKLECTAAEQNLFWFDCYYDTADNICRCFKGDISQCKVAESSLPLNDWCAYQFECVKRLDGNYQINCHFDKQLVQCRCFVGDLEKCMGEKSLLNKSMLLELEAAEKEAARKESEQTEPKNASGITGRAAGGLLSGVSGGLAQLKGLLSKPVTIASNKVPAGMVAGLAIAGFAVAAFVFLFAKSPHGDLNKARAYHRRAEELHEKGKEEAAHKYYKLADECRAKARKGE